MSSEQHSAPVYRSGASIPPHTRMHFPSVSDPPILYSKFYLFPTFFYSQRPLISNLPPIFPVSVHFPTVFHVVLSIVSYSSNNELHVCNSEVVRFKESFIGRFTAQEDQLL